MADELSLAEEKVFFEEDERSKVIKDLDDPEEIDAAIELLKDKYDVPDEHANAEVKDTTSGEAEPKKPATQVEDTSEKPKEKTEAEQKTKDDEDDSTAAGEKKADEQPVKPSEFVLTNELIQKQPEEFRNILNKYVGKGKTDLAVAAASAIVLKSPYLKDNEKAINAIVEKFSALTDEEIVKTLIETQAQTGVIEKPATKESVVTKIELPSLPENDDKVKSFLSKEVAKRLQKQYPKMPEDMDSEDYKEWERDLQDTGGLRAVEQFLTDLKTTESSVKTKMQKVIYVQTNLQNLYTDSPDEILPLLTDENLPRLKKLNDDHRSVNNKSLEEEVGLLNEDLRKLGVSVADIGIDLSLTMDKDGSLINQDLNSLMYNGKDLDSNVIGQLGKVPVLRKGQLVKKFLFEHNPEILTALVAKHSKGSKAEVERLKDDALNTLANSKNAGIKSTITTDGIKEIYDDTKLDKITQEIFNKY